MFYFSTIYHFDPSNPPSTSSAASSSKFPLVSRKRQRSFNKSSSISNSNIQNASNDSNSDSNTIINNDNNHNNDNTGSNQIEYLSASIHEDDRSSNASSTIGMPSYTDSETYNNTKDIIVENKSESIY